ncbi:exodeoxyribonuclease V subunit beta [Thalassomonas sp. M1454]|uniref:exodeoxyribonuclease V subunit beta n=1 Tax=Thalassomonas sp. M1454 TaxID=2594477 RepID=UPI00117F9322|nr:exodeoxyribonuclease V subunit beta [Thalassomonas sp. M1454]TRX56780.1 exodeoxyribonuclease V subunit beta [Thalassomonas sp. M1454]
MSLNNISNNADSAKEQPAKPLQAQLLPLYGKHLIEASAGTGKTYNITRIYLRMLLERKISTENILVMTFTKAATEEIRGRIDEFLRNTLANWSELTKNENDEFFYLLGQKVTATEAKVLIKSALLNLDEAAIYTIHGFCKRVLSQQAFASGMNFNAKMEADDNEIVEQATQDYYRLLAQSEDVDRYKMFVEYWPTPDDFISKFKSLLYDEHLPNITNEQSLIRSFAALATKAKQDILSAEALIYSELIDNKKGKTRETRVAEFEQLMIDLTELSLANFSVEQLEQSSFDFKFINGPRYKTSADKDKLKVSFAACEQLAKKLKGIGNALPKIASYELVVEAVKAIKNKVFEQKSLLSMLNFDDLISNLERALINEQKSDDKPLTNALIEQYPIALIDEFQDTDQKQFSILRQLYFSSEQGLNDEHKNTALYLIGDPKQAIYGFRGGDIFTYLSAGKKVDQQWMMDTNWRSASNMIAGYNQLFYGQATAQHSELENQISDVDVFGFGINYLPVKPSPVADKEQLVEQSSEHNFKALQFIDFNAPDDYLHHGYIKNDYRAAIADWIAGEISRLLTSTQLVNADSANLVKAGDIAILVRDGREADVIKTGLNKLGLASVYKSQKSKLFASDIAKDFVVVLNAIINAEDDRAFITALAGPYFAFNSERLFKVQNDEREWEDLRNQFNQLGLTWFKRGFMAMALNLLHNHYPGALKDNERKLTNIIHLFEVLQTTSQRLKQPQELLAYLVEQCQNPAQSEAELRLESDADLIQIITQHGSKGLEYPIVFVPFATSHKNPVKFAKVDKEVLRYHDDEGELKVHLGENDDGRARMASEGYAEDIRLLYVAITRAKHRCYLACYKSQDYHLSPLGQTLKMPVKGDFTQALQPLIDAAPSAIAVHTLQGDEFTGIAYVAKQSEEEHSCADFKGKIERDWWLSSFSALTRNIIHGGKTERDRDIDLVNLAAPLKKDVIRFAFEKGARTGNLLHDIFERIDFTNPNWQQHAMVNLTKFGSLPENFSSEDVFAWLNDTLQAPLNNQGLALNTLSQSATLREAEFYFPMEHVDVVRLKKVLQQFRQSLCQQGLLSKAQLAQVNHDLPAFGHLKGMMHGFIDLIFVDSGKYFVSDYKSSHLGDDFANYSPESLAEHVVANFYDLQFLIYSLALHRYLQTRIDDYAIESHFGGVYYLYLRGMTSNNQGVNNANEARYYGVFYQSLTKDILEQLDAIFSGVTTSNSFDAAGANNE